MTRDCVCPRARHTHGTEQAYISDRCRCQDCRTAHAQRAAWRRRQHAYGRTVSTLVPSLGSARRVEALACLGWSCEVLAARIGWDPVVLHRIRTQPRISRRKADAVRRLYDELWNTPAPAGTKSQRISTSRTRSIARSKRFAPPMAWDDDTIDLPDAEPNYGTDETPTLDVVLVERIVSGCHDVRPNSQRYRLEVAEAVRVLAGRGMTDAEVGRRIGKNRDAVCQIRHRYGIASRIPQPSKDTAA